MVESPTSGELASIPLQALAYGEQVEGPSRRSLGFRMLVPRQSQPWSDEVEGLARRLQSAPYPDHWPSTDLFCSALLENGQRLVAVARYGVIDHTASQRRGGLELFGLVGANSLGVSVALRIYYWLRHRRAELKDLRDWQGTHDLSKILNESPARQNVADPVPVLPIKLWQDGALIFAATAPSDPDMRLSMLEESESEHWQWLPLVGADFPLTLYAHRGPLVAWTPHFTGVALKLHQSSIVNAPLITAPPAPRRILPMVLLGAAVVLGVANLWATWRVQQVVNDLPDTPALQIIERPSEPARPAEEPDAFARVLYRHLQTQGCLRDESVEILIRQYDRMSATDESLRVSSREAKLVIGYLGKLEQRSATQVRDLIREIGSREFNPQVIELLSKLVYQRLSEVGDQP